MIIIDDWIRQGLNLRKACEAIRGKHVTNRCWYDWEVLAGATGKTKHLKNRIYSDEQAQMLLTVAWLRKHFPQYKLTYKSVREYYLVNASKIEECFDQFVAGNIPAPPEKEIKLVPLKKVKLCCDRIMNREISRDCWARWKQHLGVPKYAQHVEEGMASLLTFLTAWRCNNPIAPTPSISRLTFLMSQEILPHIPIEAISSARQQYQWQMQGCVGKDLPRYLASQGYKVSARSLYDWGNYRQKHHYTVSELNNWLNIAREKRNHG